VPLHDGEPGPADVPVLALYRARTAGRGVRDAQRHSGPGGYCDTAFSGGALTRARTSGRSDGRNMIRLAALRQYRHPPTSALRHAMQPWARRLALESFGRWLVRGAVAALVVMCAVLSIGWLLPVPMNDLQPIALELALPVALLGAIVGLWPASMLRRAAQLDTRLNFADRLATAWLQRTHTQAMVEMQRSETLTRLAHR